MNTREVAERLVHLCNTNAADQAAEELYTDDIVSIEAQGSDGMPARAEGIGAVREKGAWWNANHEMHAMTAKGPFFSHRDDQFAVCFDIDVTPKGASRLSMSEVAMYTVRDGKIAQEEFLY